MEKDCKHKLVQLYYRKRFNKKFAEWVKAPKKMCNKCFVYTQ